MARAISILRLYPPNFDLSEVVSKSSNVRSGLFDLFKNVRRNHVGSSVHLVISEGKPKWLTKKRFKMQNKKEKHERKLANKKDPRRLGIKGNNKITNPDDKIKYKIARSLGC